VNSRQAVIIAMFMSVAVFMLANANTSRHTGKPSVDNFSYITPRAAGAWAGLFLVFVLMTDMPATQPIGAGFAWLFFLSVVYKYGTDAFAYVNAVNTTAPATPTTTPGVNRPGTVSEGPQV